MRAARSWLFVPATRLEWVTGALEVGAHRIVIDLEDAIGATDKDRAREALVEFFEQRDRSQKLWVRTNDVLSNVGREDLKALAAARHRPNGLLLPKVEGATATRSATEQLRKLGATIRLAALIETPLGVLRAADISSEPEVSAIVFGAGDYATCMGSFDLPIGARDPLIPGGQWLFAQCQIITAARAFGKDAVDGPLAVLGEQEELTAQTAIAARLGFSGKLCIHPSQVAVINEAFRPSAEARARALQIVSQAADGGGAAAINGNEMVDAVSIRAAHELLAEDRNDGGH